MQVEETPITDLLDRHVELQDEYGRLLEQLKWTHALLAILIEEEGGVVQISSIFEDAASDSYIIEVSVNE
jgi:hypothetical protein